MASGAPRPRSLSRWSSVAPAGRSHARAARVPRHVEVRELGSRGIASKDRHSPARAGCSRGPTRRGTALRRGAREYVLHPTVVGGNRCMNSCTGYGGSATRRRMGLSEIEVSPSVPYRTGDFAVPDRMRAHGAGRRGRRNAHLRRLPTPPFDFDEMPALRLHGCGEPRHLPKGTAAIYVQSTKTDFQASPAVVGERRPQARATEKPSTARTPRRDARRRRVRLASVPLRGVGSYPQCPS